MGQSETSMTSQNSIENLNDTESTVKKEEKKTRHQEERSSKKTRSSSSVTANKSTFKYFKTNLASNTTDVELIVRKKLITTTTTTTMSPVEANNLLNNGQSFSDTSLNENFNVLFKRNELIDDSNNNKVVMERTIQNANPASTTDAVANLIQDLNSQRVNSTNGNTIAISNSNQDIDIDEEIPKRCSLKDLETNKRISTVKKEQLEYEFRIKPKQETPVNNMYCLKSSSRTDMKLRKKKYKFSFKKRDQTEGNTDDSVSSVDLVYKRYFCCGIKCCRLAYHMDNENESNEFNDENMQRSEFDLSLESGTRAQPKPKQPSNRFSSNFFCSNRNSFARPVDESNKQHQLNQKRNNFFRRSFNAIFCCCVMTNANNDENEMPHGGSSVETPSNMNSSINQKLNEIRHNQRNVNASNDNSKEDANSDYDIASNPPITCIRVLRPSNDLTPVRFDSHYNIIQAYIDNENEAGGDETAQASSEIYSNMPVTDVPENFELIDNEGDYYFDTS